MTSVVADELHPSPTVAVAVELMFETTREVGAAQAEKPVGKSCTLMSSTTISL